MNGFLPGSGKAPTTGSRGRLQRGSKTPRAARKKSAKAIPETATKRESDSNSKHRLAIQRPTAWENRGAQALRANPSRYRYARCAVHFICRSEQSQQNKFTVKPHADRRHQSSSAWRLASLVSRHKDRFVSKRMSRYSSYDKPVRNSGIGGGARNDSAASFLARSATLSKPNGSLACRGRREDCNESYNEKLSGMQT